MKKIPIMILCCLLAVWLSACVPASQDATPATASATPVSPASTSPQTASQPAPDATPADTGAAPTAGVTEKKLGYVTGTYAQNGTDYIKIDYVTMYTGDDAIQQALNDNADVVEQDENGDYYIPNDYYIQNTNTKIRTFPLDPACAITVCDSEDPSVSKNITFSELQLLSSTPLMHVDVQNGVVVSMNQQYLP